ncbi:Crp/Fnr family transcriptional regulator [Streptococcus pseudoporcinus]|uniref:Cyclic nucleotide-binding domain protein n=2 Tax=Streptococcus pseudoporcinus TaxID=361101 RepID=G5K9S7_9STRE|nr:Crp/Fnr family transcriptional regulator [Streptococcus pseudoporcinus]EFR44857.1 cyclic nucleotide-binding domain protein [Streptococcus pseudoporcinus SPIN 20026]EHI64278.1 cyclic nucleotide-binding domain protein [Streptococcus pseudoporcinus LQ 940-04]VEF93451.1 Crp family regulatory protein [Streptococcus pseudoporcinus]VTS34813.1 Crp family regulatory protein [Streptococcus pseudoporcinus]
MIRREDYQYLRKLNDFKFFSIEEFDKIVGQMECRKVQKGHILFFEGDRRDKLFLVTSGYFKVEQTDQSGSFIYTDFIRHDTIFPYGGMFTDEAYHFSVVAITDVTYYYLPVDLFEKFSADNPKQMVHLYSKLSRLLELHELRVRNLITSSASERVIQSLAILLIEMGDDENKLPFQLTSTDIANMSGTTRETVSHVLSKLKREKLLVRKNKYLTFLNRDFFLKHT